MTKAHRDAAKEFLRITRKGTSVSNILRARRPDQNGSYSGRVAGEVPSRINITSGEIKRAKRILKKYFQL